MTILQIKKLHPQVQLPKYQTKGSAGLDLQANISQPMVIKAGEIVLVPTGLAIALQEGYEAQVRPRSGLALKNGITVLNSPGTIDSDYRGEISVILINHSKQDFIITNGLRIAQLVIAQYAFAKIIEVDDLGTTQRGEGGFGSTGY
ncbi:MAG: dUTP diphosphatase [Proteobacteria bacterium]|nr:dUTP diphosphatase [Pseudomonadota bacterium]